MFSITWNSMYIFSSVVQISDIYIVIKLFSDSRYKRRIICRVLSNAGWCSSKEIGGLFRRPESVCRSLYLTGHHHDDYLISIYGNTHVMSAPSFCNRTKIFQKFFWPHFSPLSLCFWTYIGILGLSVPPTWKLDRVAEARWQSNFSWLGRYLNLYMASRCHYS